MSQSFGASNKPRERVFPELPDPEFWQVPACRSLIVFLDFDGVLHPLGPRAQRFERAPQLLTALRALARALIPASIVLSTSWRFQPRTRITAELDRAAPGLSSFIEGRSGARTEPDSVLGARGSQCATYLAARPGPEPLGALCIDDQRSLFCAPAGLVQRAPDWLLLCDPACGLPAAKELARLCSLNTRSGSELLKAARLIRTSTLPCQGLSSFASGTGRQPLPGEPR